MNIKGSALIHARDFVQARSGNNAFAELVGTLDASSRAVLSQQHLLAHGWYPVSVWNALTEEVARRESPALIRELAAYVAQQDLTTAYKILLKLGTPDLVMRRAGVFWSKYFDGGSSEGIATGEAAFRIVLNVGTDPTNDPARLTCQQAVPSWQENAIRLTGSTGGKSVHVRCRFDGHPRCEYDVSWNK